MKLKINKRIILGISIPLLVIFIVAGLNITYRSGTMHGEKNDKIMPWENHINLEGTDYIRYFTIRSKVEKPRDFDHFGQNGQSRVAFPFANADSLERPVLTPGISRITELLCKKKDKIPNRTAEHLFHAIMHFTVQRGQPQVRRIDLHKKYFRINLSVTGADKLSGNPEDFCVYFDGIPSGIDYQGAPLQKTIRITPMLTKDDTGVMTSVFDVFRFGPQNKVLITLVSKGKTIGQIPLSEYLTLHDEQIDY